MSKTQEQLVGALLLAGTVFAFGSWLASNPNCRRGCQTVAQHPKDHAAKEFLKTLLA